MSALVIANTQIRCDAAGRYCLNDLHQASGGANRHRPSMWLGNAQTKELVSLIESEMSAAVAGIPATAVWTESEGFAKGTYAVKELVYAYAMWISAAFHLHVIRAYDALITARQSEIAAPGLLAFPQHRADQLVSAGRIFAAALRTARNMRMPASRAMRAAFECTLRHTGIDWGDELDASDMLRIGEPMDEIAARIAEWLDDKDDVTGRDVIIGVGLGKADSVALLMQVGDAMREIGWIKRRAPSNGSQARGWIWSRPMPG